VRASSLRLAATPRRVLLEWALLAAASFVLVGFCVVNHVTRRADNLIYDGLQRVDGRPADPAIVVVAIDDRSVQGLGRWPWSRAQQAAVLNRLAQYRPKAVAFDVLLTEPAAGDDQLAAALSAAHPVFLPVLVEAPGENGAPYAVIEPSPPERAAAAGLGQANLDFDSDGIVRNVYLTEGDGRRQWPHLMELMRLSALGRPVPAPPQPGPAVGPLRRGAPMLISYAGPPGHFPTVSMIDVFRGETPDVLLRDRLVLVGATASGLGDRFPTPVSSNTEIMSGVELQANILDSLLGGHLIRPVGAVGGVALSLVPLVILFGSFLRLRPLTNLGLGIGLVAGVLAVSLTLFAAFRIWWPPATALGAIVLLLPVWSWRRLAATSAYMVEELGRFEAEADPLPNPGAEPAPPTSDVTDRQSWLMRHAIRRARDLRRFMADTVNGLPDATLVIDPSGRVQIANQEAERLFSSLAGGSPLGRPIEDLLRLFRPAAPAPEHTDPRSRNGRYDGEYETAQAACYHVRDIAFRDSGDTLGGRIIRFTDITEMKVAVRQREQALQLLSHDMRSPQVSIIALLGQEQRTDAEADERARRIGDYARRTLALADNFVQLARAENPNYAFELVNLADVLLDAVDDLWPQAHARSVTVSTSGCEEEFIVRADRSLLTRVFINIIDNAIKYSPDGGQVECTVGPDVGGVRVAIRDHGPGMTPAQRDRLFEPFHRAAQGARPVGGVGLGLTFVRTVIVRHGGAIDCESEPGEGATFRLTLPLAETDRLDA
jgi:CHASE2 domain-containing sensor protein/signal transduction histidine kinase